MKTKGCVANKIAKRIALFVCIAAMFVSLAGCRKSTKPIAEISIFIWSEYLPQTVLDKFQERYNVKVNMSLYTSDAEMYAKVKGSPKGTYDVIDVGGDFYIIKLKEEGYLAKLNHANIPNIRFISPDSLGKYYDPNNDYSVPYMGVVATLCYNINMVQTPVFSYIDLYRPEFKNSLVLPDDYRLVIGSINLMLGYDFNERDPAKLALTQEKLIELKPNVKLLDSDSPKTAMISGETSAGLMYSGEIAIAMEENPDIKIVFPPEGQYYGFDSLCVAEGAKNKEWAEKLINFILEPEISKMISDMFPYANPNMEAVKILGETYLNNPAKNIPSDALARSQTTTDLDNETLSLYNDIWTQFTK
jgi:spermidine/putrescine-binding protein